MSQSPERESPEKESLEKEVEAVVENGEEIREDRMEDVEKDEVNGAHDDNEEKSDREVERSPSPRARSASPARDISPDSRSRSPVPLLSELASLPRTKGFYCDGRSRKKRNAFHKGGYQIDDLSMQVCRGRSDSRDRARSDSRENRRKRSRCSLTTSCMRQIGSPCCDILPLQRDGNEWGRNTKFFNGVVWATGAIQGTTDVPSTPAPGTSLLHATNMEMFLMHVCSTILSIDPYYT